MVTRPTILLTGFGAFPGVGNNATGQLIPKLTEAARAKFTDHNVVGEILPVEWARAPQALARLLEGTKAALALHFGVSHEATGFQLELIGRNVRDSQQDAAGELPPCAAVIESGPAMLVATLPAERIVARLARRGFPCRTSNNAGTYLCNALLYHSLTAARALPEPFLSGFVHIPASLSGHGRLGREAHPDCPLSWAIAVAGSLEIIAACLEYGALA